MFGDPEKRFPVQGEHVRLAPEPGQEHGATKHRERGWVPWAVAEAAYKVYAVKYGKDQSLEMLAKRGGFGWSELVWLLRGGDDNESPVLPFCEPGSE